MVICPPLMMMHTIQSVYIPFWVTVTLPITIALNTQLMRMPMTILMQEI